MAVTKLGLWNECLTAIGERSLTDTGEVGPAGRALSDVYDNVVEDCLLYGAWNFATETIQVDADTGVTPSFGYTQVFAKPSDWLRTIAVSGDDYFSFPLLSYVDDVNYWSSDISPMYVRYISNDTGLGLELSRWPRNFQRYVALELADRIVERVSQNASKKEDIQRDRDRARREALNTDAMNSAQPQFPPPSSWTLARGGRAGRGERGSRNKLYG